MTLDEMKLSEKIRMERALSWISTKHPANGREFVDMKGLGEAYFIPSETEFKAPRFYLGYRKLPYVVLQVGNDPKGIMKDLQEYIIADTYVLVKVYTNDIGDNYIVLGGKKYAIAINGIVSWKDLSVMGWVTIDSDNAYVEWDEKDKDGDELDPYEDDHKPISADLDDIILVYQS